MVVRSRTPLSLPRVRRVSGSSFLFVALVSLNTALLARMVTAQAVPPAPAGRSQAEVNRPADAELTSGDFFTVKGAVERFLKDNLELRVLRQEIPIAAADVEAAGQRPQAHLLIKAGGGRFQNAMVEPWEPPFRPWIDAALARAITRTVEAQYEDAVRLRVDNLFSAFVDLQAAQVTVRHAVTNRTGIGKLFELCVALQKSDQLSRSDVALTKARLAIAEVAVADAEHTLRKAKLVVANLLNLTDAQGERLGAADDLESATSHAPEAPPLDELTRIAQRQRPDLRAGRLGLLRSELAWIKASLEPINQIRVQPGIEGSNLAASVTLPTSVANRATLKRASLKVDQTRTLVAKIERDVILDVRKARLDYEQSRATVKRFRDEIIPAARQSLDASFRLFTEGEKAARDYFASQDEFNEMTARYVEAVIALERNMLALNTALGKSVMP